MFSNLRSAELMIIFWSHSYLWAGGLYSLDRWWKRLHIYFSSGWWALSFRWCLCAIPQRARISLDIVEVDLLPICTSSSMHFSNFGSCNRCSMIQKADQVSQCTDAGYVAVERHFLASCLCTVHGAKRTGLFHGWCSPSMRLEFDLVV